MKNILLAATLLLGSSAFAAETTCTVKGMHCTGCKEMIEGKICDESKYSTCDVKISDAKKKIGSIHLVTKENGATIDEKAIGTIVSDAGYKVEKCTAAKAPAKKST